RGAGCDERNGSDGCETSKTQATCPDGASRSEHVRRRVAPRRVEPPMVLPCTAQFTSRTARTGLSPDTAGGSRVRDHQSICEKGKGIAFSHGSRPEWNTPRSVGPRDDLSLTGWAILPTS